MTTTRVEFDQLAKLAGEVRRAESAVVAGIKNLSGARFGEPTAPPMPRMNAFGGITHTPQLPAPTPFGNTSGGQACQAAHLEAKYAMDAMLAALAGVLDGDADRLEMAAALYREADARSQSLLTVDNVLRANRNSIDVFSAHLDARSGKEGDAERAAQARELLEAAGPASGGRNTVVAGDLNASLSNNTEAGRAIGSFAGQGFDVRAGELADGRGTSESYHKIDHLMPRGLGTPPNATRWDRQISDHDGQQVDLTLPHW